MTPDLLSFPTRRSSDLRWGPPAGLDHGVWPRGAQVRWQQLDERGVPVHVRVGVRSDVPRFPQLLDMGKHLGEAVFSAYTAQVGDLQPRPVTAHDISQLVDRAPQRARAIVAQDRKSVV